MMAPIHRDLAMNPVSLRHAVMALLHDCRHDRFAVLRFGPGAGWSSIVEVVSDLTTSEDLRCDHLRMHVTLLITQEERMHAVILGPKLGIRDADRQPGSSGGPAEDKGVYAFGSDHARVWQRPRTFLNDRAFEGATGQEHDREKQRKKIGTHRRRDEEGETFVVFSGPGRQRFIPIHVKAERSLKIWTTGKIP